MSEIDEKEIKRRFEVISHFEPSSEVTARDLEKGRKRLIRHMSGQQPGEQKIWRIIMKSRITKLAAAAVIIVAVILGLNITGGPDIAGVTWAEVIEKVEQISALTYDMTSEISYPGNKTLTYQCEIYIAGDYGTKSSIYMNGELFVVKYLLPRKKLAYHIRPKDKTYIRRDLSDEQAARLKEPDDPRTWLKTVLSGDYIELGRDNINGVVVEGIKCSMTEKTGEDTVMRLWVGVETNLPVRIEIEGFSMEGGQMRPHKDVMENFQWDVELDASIFEPNIPNDYKLRDVQNNPQQVEQKPPRLLTDTEKDEQPMVKEFVRKLFQACRDEDWDEFATLCPNLRPKWGKKQKTFMGGLEIVHIGEPFKTDDSSKWYVPYEIKSKLEFGRIRKNTLRIRYDEATQKYIPRGGL